MNSRLNGLLLSSVLALGNPESVSAATDDPISESLESTSATRTEITQTLYLDEYSDRTQNDFCPIEFNETDDQNKDENNDAPNDAPNESSFQKTRALRPEDMRYGLVDTTNTNKRNENIPTTQAPFNNQQAFLDRKQIASRLNEHRKGKSVVNYDNGATRRR